MKKLLTLCIIPLLFGCSESSSDQAASPAISSITVGNDGIIYNNQEAAIMVGIEENGHTLSSVEFHIDGQLCKTLFKQPFQYRDTFRDLTTGEHDLHIVAHFDNGKKVQKGIKFTFRVNLGDEYQGGVIVRLKNDGINGVIAAASDLNGGVAGQYQYGAYNGYYEAFSMEDGVANTQKFSGKFDNDYAATACLNSGLNGKNDWYLPAYNELAYFEDFLEQLNIPVRSGWIYWSSTGDKDNEQQAYAYPFGVTFGTPCDMQGRYRVRCCRRF